MGLLDPPSPGKSQNDKRYMRKPAAMADLVSPVIVPHRGGGALQAPQNTPEGFQAGEALGLSCIDGGDLRLLRDGTFLCYHDTALNVWTSVNANPYDLSSGAAQMVTVDPPRWFGGTSTNTRLMTWAQIARLYGGRYILTPELKFDGTGAPYTSAQTTAAFIASVQRAGLTDSIIACSTDGTSCATMAAAGIRAMRIISGNVSAVDPTTLTSVGVYDLCIDFSANTPSVCTAFNNAGVKVWPYTPCRQVDRAAWVAAGAYGFYSDDPVYFAGDVTKYRRTTDPFALKNYYPGHLPYGTGALSSAPGLRGTFVGANRWLPASQTWCLMGWGCPVANPTAYTLGYNLTFDALGSDTSRNADVFFACPDDSSFHNIGETNGNGYNLIVRVTGQVQLYKVTAGVVVGGVPIGTMSSTAISAPLVLSAGLTSGAAITSLPVNALPAAGVPSGAQFVLPTGQVATTSASAASGATSVSVNSITPSAAVASGTSIPQTVPMTIAVNSTQITVTRTDTATTMTVTDSTWRGGYFHAGLGDSGAGLQVSFSSMSIT